MTSDHTLFNETTPIAICRSKLVATVNCVHTIQKVGECMARKNNNKTEEMASLTCTFTGKPVLVRKASQKHRN